MKIQDSIKDIYGFRENPVLHEFLPQTVTIYSPDGWWQFDISKCFWYNYDIRFVEIILIFLQWKVKKISFWTLAILTLVGAR